MEPLMTTKCKHTRLFSLSTVIILTNLCFVSVVFPSISFADSAVPLATQQPEIIKHYDMQSFDITFSALIAKHNRAQLPSDYIAEISGRFLGKPYLLGALGEGKRGEFDQGPLYRPDAFDCQTYVETILALTNSYNLNDFRRNMLSIRYANGQPLFINRNHFMNVDWNFNNEKKGYVVNVTEKLFPTEYQTSTTFIDKPNWFRSLKMHHLKLLQQPNETTANQLLERLHALANDTFASESSLSYVPLTALFDKNGQPNMALFNRIPNNVIIEIVRPNWDIKNLIGTNIDISHDGLALWINQQLIFREASTDEHKVIDIPLTEYLQKFLTSKTVKGIHIEKIVENTKGT
jgi:hypothetical protein